MTRHTPRSSQTRPHTRFTGALSARRKLFSRVVAIVAVTGLGVAGSIVAITLTGQANFGDTEQADAPSAHQTQEVLLGDGERFELMAGFINNSVKGVEQTMMAYNGSTPGPTIRVTQGAAISIDFTNNTDMETTVHAHGLRQEVSMDGMPGISQEPVAVGGSFTYTWSFPDPGVYWYHPHVREDYQQASGLYGTIIVEPADRDYWPAADAEQTLVLNDVLVDERTGIMIPFPQDQADHTLMGRYGNVALINGNSNWKGAINQGDVTRVNIVNAANARPYRFSMSGLPMKIVGSDNGRVGTERLVTAITLSPGERVIIDVLPDRAGSIALENDTGFGVVKLGAIDVRPTEVTPAAAEYPYLRTNQDVVAAISALKPRISDNKELTLSMGAPSRGMNQRDSGRRVKPVDGLDQETTGIEWNDNQMNAHGMRHGWAITDFDKNRLNSNIDWSFDRGKVVRVVVTNPSQTMHPMQHPIHFHGQRFAVTEINGEPNPQLEWKDVATIPRGASYELLVEMDQPGTWMVHCHIAEHAEAGMLMHLTVRP